MLLFIIGATHTLHLKAMQGIGSRGGTTFNFETIHYCLFLFRTAWYTLPIHQSGICSCQSPSHSQLYPVVVNMRWTFSMSNYSVPTHLHNSQMDEEWQEWQWHWRLVEVSVCCLHLYLLWAMPLTNSFFPLGIRDTTFKNALLLLFLLCTMHDTWYTLLP